MSIETESTPTKVQMQAVIAQTLSKPFAYNAPVVVLDFSVNDQGEFEGKFKDAARPRIFSFNIEGQSVTFKPYAPGRMDSAEDWEEFSSGYSYRVDAGIGGNKKPQCVKPTAYNCGAACINIMKSCKTKTDDPTIKDRLKKLKTIGEDYAKTTPKTKAKKPPASTPELKPEPKKVAPEVKKQQSTNLVGDGTHDGTPGNAQEYYDAMTKSGKKISMKEAEDTVDSIKYWTGKGSYDIREDQKAGQENEHADRIDNFIKNSTPYKGEIYRGINFSSEEEAMKWAKGDKDGIIGNQSAHASWTSDVGIATTFTELDFSGEKPTQVILKTTNKSGASIRNLSVFGKPEAGKLGKDEKEVIVSKNTRHKFKNATKKDGILYIEVEEVETTPKEEITKPKEVKSQQQFPSQKVGKLTPSVASIKEKQTQEKTKPLSIAQKNAQTIENLAKKAGVDVSKLVETARKAGATEAQLLTLKNGVANYMKAKGIVPGSELKTTRSEEEGLTGDGSHEGMPRNAQEYYNLATKNGKQITLKEAQDTVDAIKDWAGAGYEEIRKDQKEGRVNERATLIDNYIKNLTPYKGEVYRGITFDNKKEMDAWLKGDKDGILGNQNAHASWSSELEVAKDFASVEDDLGRVSVVIKSVNNKSGVSISNLSSYGKTESEVIVSKDAKHKVKSVREEGGVVYVEVEEVDSPPEKSSTKQEEVKTQQKTPEQKVGKLTPSLVSKEDQIKTAKEWYATAKQFKIKGKKILDALSEDDMIGGEKVNREALENTLDLVFDSSIVIDGLIYSAQEKPGKQDTIFLKDESGNAQGFFMVGNEKSKDSMYIEYLGTNPLNIIQSKKGVGKQIMYQAIQESIKRGLKGRIKLEALDTSESFYEAVGFQRKTEKVFEDSEYYDTDYFELSEESAKAFVEKYEKTLK